MRPDLKKHILGGFVAGFLASFICLAMFFPPQDILLALFTSLLVGWVAGLKVGWIKEKLWDRALGHGHYDVLDAHYTGYGGLAGGVVVAVFFLIYSFTR
jgi:hypothetical protein